MVVNTLKKTTAPAAEPLKPEPGLPAEFISAKKRIFKKEKTAKKQPAAPVKSKVSVRAKQAIEKSYREKIQQAIKDLPVRATADASELPAKLADRPKVAAPAKESKLKALGPDLSGPALSLDTEAIRQAVLAELTGEPAAPVIKAFNKRAGALNRLPAQEKIIETAGKIHIHLGGQTIALHHPRILIRPLTSLAVSLVLIVVVSLAGVYLGGWDNPLLLKAAGALKLPALYVEGKPTGLRDFYEDTAAFLAYQKRLGNFLNQEQVRQQVFKSLVEKGVIASLAQAKNLSVSQAEVDRELNFIIASSGSEQELQQLIAGLYGWDLEKYTEKVIRPLLLAQKVAVEFNLSGGNAEIKKNLQDWRRQVIEGQADFAELAGRINEDDTRFSKGDLGWFKTGDISPQFEIQFLNLKAGELSPVFESGAGYHVIKLAEKSADGGGQFSYHLQQLFLKKNSFEDYLDGQIKKAKVVALIKI